MDDNIKSSGFPSSSNSDQQLDQFVILAKTTKGVALKTLVIQAMEAPGVYFFGELLDLPCIQEMSSNPDSSTYFDLLNIFAYGKYRDYTEKSSSLPQISDIMRKKLRYLTVASLACELKLIPYPKLLEELELTNLRELEDLLIAAIYADVIKGKLDQQNSRLEIDWAIGRDIKPDQMEYVLNTLGKWGEACETIIESIQTQVCLANTYVVAEKQKQEQIDTEITNIKKTIKATLSQQDMDLTTTDNALYATTSSGSEVKSKKSRMKGLRGSGKTWSKN